MWSALGVVSAESNALGAIGMKTALRLGRRRSCNGSDVPASRFLKPVRTSSSDRVRSDHAGPRVLRRRVRRGGPRTEAETRR